MGWRHISGTSKGRCGQHPQRGARLIPAPITFSDAAVQAILKRDEFSLNRFGIPKSLDL
jgi:hypothetical protein